MCEWNCRYCEIKEAFPERFWARVDQSGGPDACWPWLGKINKRRGGYGVVSLPDAKGKEKKAHRVAYLLAIGPLEDDLGVLHTCDNPPCCNPRHLFKGTQLDNVTDMMVKGRSKMIGDLNPSRRFPERHRAKRYPESVPRGEQNGYSKLTNAQVLEIKARLAAGESCEQIAVDYPVTKSSISHIKTGRSWGSVLAEAP